MRLVGVPRRVVAPMTSSTAWLPTKRSPLPRSKHRKCVQLVLEVDRRPQEEDLRARVVGRGAGRLADGAHAPRTILRAVQPVDAIVAPPVVIVAPTTCPTA